MNSALTNWLKKEFFLPDLQVKELHQISRVVSLKKEEIFIAEGQVPRKMAIVIRGIFRYFYVDANGNEFTKGFFAEKDFLTSYTAMVTQKPSHFGIEALEDSEILVFEYDQWTQLLNESVFWQKFLIKILEMAFGKKEKREREFLLYGAEARYRIFLQERPGLEFRLKQYMIASYLGISDVALSRIRRKMETLNKG